MNEIFLLSTTPMLGDCIEKFATSYEELRKIAVNHVCQEDGACHENLEVRHAPTRMMITVINGMFETEFHIIKLERA